MPNRFLQVSPHTSSQNTVITVVGVNHKSAPLSIRERVAMRDSEMAGLLEHLRKHALEVVLLSTCNRTEVYFAGVQGDALAAFEGAWGVSMRPYLYCYQGRHALEHLYQVSSGLDSLVLGETQILGQVRRAWQTAHSQGHTHSVLNKAFQSALEVGKQVRHQTGISDVAVSVSYAAVQLAQDILGDLTGKTALVVGAGETAELTLTHLKAKGIAEVYVVNRTVERAQKLADQWGGKACAVDRLCEVLPHADVVIASSAAPHYVIQPHRVRHALEQRLERPMFLIDISVPRIIDPEVGHLEGAYLYNLDDLTSIVERNLHARASKIPQAQKIIAAALERYLHWYAMYQNRAVLQQQQATLEALVQQELLQSGTVLSELTPRQRRKLEGATRHRLSAQFEGFPIFVTVLEPAQRVN